MVAGEPMLVKSFVGNVEPYTPSPSLPAEEPFLIMADHHEIRKLSVDGSNYTILKQVRERRLLHCKCFEKCCALHLKNTPLHFAHVSKRLTN